MTKILTFLLVCVMAIFGIRSFRVLLANDLKSEEILSNGKRDRRVLQVEIQKREFELIQEYDRKKHLATGKDVYERIFNTPDQSISTMIKRLAQESLPRGWGAEVRVEEFTHFILLVYLPRQYPRVALEQITPDLKPVLKYSKQWLTDVAIYDATRTSYLFLEEAALRDIEEGKPLSSEASAQAQRRGEAFGRFNSTVIRCKTEGTHFWIPTEISGPEGGTTCMMLLDTGASKTMISRDVLSKTGVPDFAMVRQEEFRTASGTTRFPVVKRWVSTEGHYGKEIDVCVGPSNLLGMNYFEGLKYIVSSADACVYVWKE